MNSKQSIITLTDSAKPQKFYQGAQESQKRRINRDHLFSGRLHSLASKSNGRPLPVFEHPKQLILLKVDYFGKEFELIMSRQDKWTETWVHKLRNFSKQMDYQFSLPALAVNAAMAFTGLGNFVTTVFKQFVGTMSAALISVMLALGILLKSNDTFVCCQAMTLIITNLGVSISTLGNIVWPLFPAKMLFQDASKPFTWIPSAVGVLLCIVMGGYSAGQFIGIFSKTATLGYTLASVNGLSRIITEAIKELLPFVYRTITGREWEVENLAQQLTSYTDFITGVEEFEQKHLVNLESDWAAQKRVFELQALYKTLVQEAEKLRLKGQLIPLIQTYNQKVQTWTKRVTASGILLAGHRCEPISILISGKPGMGKSYMVNELVRDVGEENIKWGDIPNETITNHIYVRNPQEKYWSGYRGQFCTLYDDFGQVADTEGSPDPEFCELIQAVGDNPFKIPMADLEEKNKGYFRSSFIVATTNLTRFASTTIKSIRSPDALARRFDIHVVLKKTGKDAERSFDVMLDGEAKKNVTYETLVNLLRAKLRIKQQKHRDRTEQGQKKESIITHRCIAKLIGVISAPSSITGTEMKREQHNEEAPNHSFCHISLPCRMTHQGWFDWVFGRGGNENTYPIKFYLGQLLWDPHLLDNTVITGLNKELFKEDIAQVWELLYENGFNLDNYDTEGLRFNPAWDFLKEKHMHLLRRSYEGRIPFHDDYYTLMRWNPTAAEAFDELATEGVIPTTDLLTHIAYVVGNRIISLFKATVGFLKTLAIKLCMMAHHNQFVMIGLVVSVRILVEIIINTLSENIFGSKVTSETEDEDDAVLAETWSNEADQTETFYTVHKGEVQAWRKYESHSEKGAQLSNKHKTHHMVKESKSKQIRSFTLESRSEKGAQLSNRSRTVLMQRENELPKFGLLVKEGNEIQMRKIDTSFLQEGDFKIVTKQALQQFENMAESAFSQKTINNLEKKRENFFIAMRTAFGTEKALEGMGASQEVIDVITNSTDGDAYLKYCRKNYVKFNYEGSADQNADGISKSISNNIYDIKSAGAIHRLSQIFFYSGRKAWLNKHSYHLLKGHDVVITRYRKDGGPEETEYKWTDIKAVSHPELDIVLLLFPKTMAPHTSNTHHLMKDSDLNWKVLPGCRLITRRDGEIVYMQAPQPYIIQHTQEHQETEIPAGTAIGYSNMHTVAGDCGAPLLVLDATRQRKICGMHFLGNAFGQGESVLITKELIESMETFFEESRELEYQMDIAPAEEHEVIGFPLGTIPTPFEPTKTKVRRSIIYGQVSEPITAPSILRSYNGTHPMDRGLRELQGKNHILSNEFIDEAQGVLTRYTGGRTMLAETLTLDQALSGEGIQGLEPIDISTSAGLPLCMEPGANGKSKWINEDRTPTPEFREMMEEFINQLREGKLKDVPIFKETLKDERVKKAKADYNNPDKIKTRLFSASPLKLLVALRMYYGAFMAHAIRNEIRNTCTSGSNPMGPDWQMMADWLHEVSDKVDDGDYSCFDTSQPSGLLIAVYKSIRTWYNRNGGSEEDDVIRDRLSELCYHPFRSAQGVVYRTNGKLPSGMFGTTQINSGSNLVAFFYAFKRLFPTSTCSDFLDNVRTLTHGDDVLFSVRAEYSEFTSENIGKALKEIGMTFTPADKGGVASVARPIEQVSFLKRGFKKIGGIYRAPLATESSLEMCNWITKSPDPIRATIDNCAAAIKELAISEDSLELQYKIIDAVYKATDGAYTLCPLTQREAVAQLHKFF